MWYQIQNERVPRAGAAPLRGKPFDRSMAPVVGMGARCPGYLCVKGGNLPKYSWHNQQGMKESKGQDAYVHTGALLLENKVRSTIQYQYIQMSDLIGNIRT